jgi:histidinol-phosphatase (PHP family)
VLPADNHVHSEWSWDAPFGAMERTCERAVELGLPAIAFTEHADYSPFLVQPDEFADHPHIRANAVDGVMYAPRMNVEGYLECLERCRERFPSLRIVSGLEFGEPHWHAGELARLLSAGRFDRVLGSLHCLPAGQWYAEPPHHFRQRPSADVMREYLAEIARLIEGSDRFAVLAHIDYPVRYWPSDVKPFAPKDFEDEFRHALRTLAMTGRALEVNTRTDFPPDLVRWFYEEGGQAISFGSDAHVPQVLARGFADAAAMVEAQGFRPGAHPYAFWVA